MQETGTPSSLGPSQGLVQVGPVGPFTQFFTVLPQVTEVALSEHVAPAADSHEIGTPSYPGAEHALEHVSITLMSTVAAHGNGLA